MARPEANGERAKELPAASTAEAGAKPSRRADDNGWSEVSDAADVMERVQRRAAEDRRAARRGTLDAGV